MEVGIALRPDESGLASVCVFGLYIWGPEILDSGQFVAQQYNSKPNRKLGPLAL